MVRNYLNGESHGEWKSWYTDGQQEYDGYYENGNASGYWRTWDNTGKLIRETQF